MEKNLILIGMMGCGKSTVGRLLAEALGREFLDTDAELERRERSTVSELFAAKGESGFRALERALSEELARTSGLVIACGGGLPLTEGSIAALKGSGTVVWLRRDPGESYDGLELSGRPLAREGREAFLARFARRAPVYERWADVTVEDFSSPEATRNAVLEAWK